MDEQTPHPDADQELEQLVAYLDGELPPDECRHVERRLSDDEPFRRQLQGLDIAWHALDELPPTTVDDSFARTTIEMVTLAAENELATKAVALPTARRRQSLLAVLACVATASAGFATARFALPNSNRSLIEDLPILLQLDNYAQFRDVRFLGALESDVGVAELSENSDQIAAAVTELRAIAGETPQQRRRRIEHMTRDDQTKLAASSERFRRLPELRQQEIRNLHIELLSDSSTAELQEMLIAYGQWVNELSPGDQAALRDLDTNDRVKRIEQLIRRGQWKASMQLSDQDAAALRAELVRLVDERVEDLNQRWQKNDAARRSRLNVQNRPPQQQLRRFALWEVTTSLERDEQRYGRLVSVLSEKAQQHLQSERQRRNVGTLRRWIHDVIESESRPGDLEDFFVNKLDNNRREELLTLPPLEMQDALEAQFLQESSEWAGLPPSVWKRLPSRGDRPGQRPRLRPEDRDRRGPRSGPGPRRNGRGRFDPPDDDREPPPANSCGGSGLARREPFRVAGSRESLRLPLRYTSYPL